MTDPGHEADLALSHYEHELGHPLPPAMRSLWRVAYLTGSRAETQRILLQEIDAAVAVSGYHWHIRAYVSFAEGIRRIRDGEEGPFEYCDLCKCVPTSIVAKDPGRLTP